MLPWEQAEPEGKGAHVPHSEQQEASGRRQREATGHSKSCFAGEDGMGRAGEGQRQRHRVAEKKAGGEGRRGQGAGTGSLRGFCEGARVLLCLLTRRRGPVLEEAPPAHGGGGAGWGRILEQPGEPAFLKEPPMLLEEREARVDRETGRTVPMQRRS